MNQSSTLAGQPADSALPAEPLEPADYSEFLLRSRSEILFVLRGLVSDGDPVTVHFNDGRDQFLTTARAVDGDGIVIDLGADAATNDRARRAEKLFCVTNHERVRVQFLLRGLQDAEHAGRRSFRAALPDSLLRLQRREYYRLTAPAARPLQCLIPPPQGREAIPVNVIDISGGGVAVMVPPDSIPFAPEMRFANCRVDLPEVGQIVATLEVRSLFDVTLRSGTQVKRAGCRFVDLPGPMLTLVQRYIIKVERERKARETGMA